MSEEDTKVEETAEEQQELFDDESTIVDPKGKEEESGTPPEKEEKKSSEPDVVEYTLSLPEGSFQTEADLERTTEIAKKWGLSNEAAQAVISRVDEVVARQHEQAQAEASSWATQVKKDPELGGEKYNEVKQIAKRGATRFASEKLVALMNETRLGNHPEVVRLFYKIGLEFKDDTIVMPEARSEPKKPKSLGERLYSKPKEKE